VLARRFCHQLLKPRAKVRQSPWTAIIVNFVPVGRCGIPKDQLREATPRILRGRKHRFPQERTIIIAVVSSRRLKVEPHDRGRDENQTLTAPNSARRLFGLP